MLRYGPGLAVVALLAILSPAVEAQGFLEKLFGWGGSAPAPAPQPQALPQMPPQGGATPYGMGARPPNPWLPQRENPDDGSRGGNFRTLCVRTCDGFYWPISHSARRSNFYRDASRCRASCGEEALLFFHPTTGDQTAMVDLSGRAYAKLPNAYKYRKSLVQGCRCRPEPWAVSEVERHRSYAFAEAAERQQQEVARQQAEATRQAQQPGKSKTSSTAAKAGAEGEPPGAGTSSEKSTGAGPQDADQAASHAGPEEVPNNGAPVTAESKGGAKSMEAAQKATVARARPAPRQRPTAPGNMPPRALPVAQPAQPPPQQAAFPWSGGSQTRLVWPGDR